MGDRCRGAGHLARRRVAMAAFIGEGGVERQTHLGMDARLGSGAFEHSQEQVFRLRVSDRTGCFTLLTAYAAFWIDKHSFHFQPTSFDIFLFIISHGYFGRISLFFYILLSDFPDCCYHL
jgi:hypothetical protein